MAPILPDPVSLMSFFKKIFVNKKPKGIEPNKYDKSDKIKTKNVKTNLLQNISLFDIYRDEKQFINKKAYGLRFQFLHPKRTLTDKEVDKVMLQIQYSILKETNGQLR